ncbi:MAG: Bug family tripartite tricarboxylate transporter substrate binding protein [Xanthobacteraceae bacterium]
MSFKASFAIAFMTCLGMPSPSVLAQPYPAKPIRLIVTFPPGGSSDIVARAMQPHLEKRLGQPIVIDNRPGAGGVIGLDAVAKSLPDGYLIGVGAAGALVVNVSLREKMPFDPLTDLAPISGLAITPFVLAAPLSFPPSSLAEVIALARERPRSISIGHGGNGTAMHLTAQLLNHMAGINLTLVPYRGTGPVTQDVLAGHVQLGITDIPSSISLIESKQIKIFAVSSANRVTTLPDVPTFAEAGLPGYESIGWFGFMAPAGTPGEAIARLNEAIVTALHSPDVQEQIRKIGAEPMPMTPAQFSDFMRSEISKWAKVVAESGVRAQ